MEVLAERTRQALHLGDLKPTSLEAHHKMLDQAGEYATQLRKLQKALRTWQHYTTEFLCTAGSFVKDTPDPMLWRQEELTEPATSCPAPIVAEHAQLFDKEFQEELACSVPEILTRAVEAELMHPIELFLTAFDSAKERMGPLDSLRLRYDAARRRISSEAAQKASEVAGTKSGHLTTHGKEQHMDPVKAAVEEQHKTDPVLQEFELEEQATWEHLAWLTNASIRLKAYVTHVLRYTRDAALASKVPPNLLEAFPTRVLRVKEGAGADGCFGKEKAPAEGEEQAAEKLPDTATARDQGAEVTGGSGASAFKLVGAPSIGATEYLLVGGTAKEAGVVPSANKAPDQPPEAVAKRWESGSVITTHGVGYVVVEPAAAPHTDKALQTKEPATAHGSGAQGSATDQGSVTITSAKEPLACPGVPPGEFAPKMPPVGADGQPLDIDEEYEKAALAVAAAKAACLDRQEEQQGQQGRKKHEQESVAMEGTEGLGRGGVTEGGVTTAPHAAVRGSKGEGEGQQEGQGQQGKQQQQEQQPEWAEGREPAESAAEVAALLEPGRSPEAEDMPAVTSGPKGHESETAAAAGDVAGEGDVVGSALGAIKQAVEEVGGS